MTYDEYNDRLKALQDEFRIKERELLSKYALSNNPCKVGEVATDHIGSIRIEKITTGIGSDRKPTCIYHGLELKKDLTPRKDGSRRQVWQINLNK